MTFDEKVKMKARIRERDGNRCVDCGMTAEECAARITGSGRRLVKLHVHRLIPGGEYCFDNCVTVCASCHRQRHMAMPDYLKPYVRKKLKAALGEYAGIPVRPGPAMAVFGVFEDREFWAAMNGKAVPA